MNKLFKIFAALFVVTLGAMSASAQDTSTAHFGVRANLNLNQSTTHTSATQWSPGVSVGGVYYAPFSRTIYFQGGLMLDFNTLGFDAHIGDKYSQLTHKGHFNIIGMQMPLDLGYEFVDNGKINVSAFTGPNLNLVFSAKANYDAVRPSGITHVNEKISNPGLEFAWHVGASVELYRHWYMDMRINYGLSTVLTAKNLVLADKSSALSMMHLSLGLGYNF